MTRAGWVAAAFGFVISFPVSVLAGTPTYYADRAAFVAAAGPPLVTDDYANAGYVFIQNDAAMSAVFGQTTYTSTGFTNHNIVSGAAYCAGCNGSFRLGFQNTTVGTNAGVFGAGLDINYNATNLRYHAFITFGDDTTTDVALPDAPAFWGVTAPERIKTIHFGLQNGGTTQGGTFQIDNLTVGGTICNQAADCPAAAKCETVSCVANKCVYAPLVCTAKDQCHDPGTCDMATGVCSDPAKPDDTACNDGNACTQTDKCTLGVCTGSNPVVCTAKDACHDVGVCDPANGTCSDPTKPNGSACSDSNSCTNGDSCQEGVCKAGAGVTCAAVDECHEAGECNPDGGVCSSPPKADGSPCKGGTCKTGTCVPTPAADAGSSGNTGGTDAGTATGSDGGAAAGDGGGAPGIDPGGEGDAAGCTCTIVEPGGAGNAAALGFGAGLLLVLRARRRTRSARR